MKTQNPPSSRSHRDQPPPHNFTMLTITKAALIGMLMESIVYGVYFTVFLRTLHILCRKLVPGFVRGYLATTTLVLFILITLKLGIDTGITVTLFTPEDGAIPITTKLAKLSSGIYVSLTIIADIFIVFRVSAVWSRNPIVSAIPCSISLAGIVSGGFLVANSGNSGFNEPRGLFTTFYCITLVLNILCTALIASKFYILEYQTKLSSSLRLRWTSVVVIESAAIYSACVIVVVVCNVVKADSVHLIVLLTTPSVIGLTFSLIIVRIGSGVTPNKTFTSIGISRGSVLRFGTDLRTVSGDEEIELNTRSNGQISEKITVASMTPTTVQLNSAPSDAAMTSDIENQVGYLTPSS
ncbi:hypothetical protein PM082_014114 [Marasmius tenuissimus]|nr:hypothetical protein PM082_014114 [Marasmius tenuissimus]